ncbi:MAG: hypothetical protein IJM37_09880 [Lachnospiraceae bacterium]|nr:hypothetical protein [Lachnospiraceae bacterium]
MKKKLVGVLIAITALLFLLACSNKYNRLKEDTNVSITETDEMGRYDRLPAIYYNKHDYIQYGNPWRDVDEEWLNANYTFLGDVIYYPDDAFIKDRSNLTTNIDEGGCKIYKCNSEDTFLFALWSNGQVQLFVQNEMTQEEIESASAATEWKNN